MMWGLSLALGAQPLFGGITRHSHSGDIRLWEGTLVGLGSLPLKCPQGRAKAQCKALPLVMDDKSQHS